MATKKVLPKVTSEKKEKRIGRGQHPNSKAALNPIKPGEVRNPTGKAPGTKDRSTLLRKWLESKVTFTDPTTKLQVKGTVEDEVMLALIREARKGNVVAIKEIQDTLHGKLTDKHELGGVDGNDLMAPIADAMMKVYGKNATGND